MILLLLLVVPSAGALVAWFRRPLAGRTLLAAAALHTALAAVLWLHPGATLAGGWLAVDALGLVVLTLASVLFLATAHYAVEYMRAAAARGAPTGRAFVSCLLAFEASATLVSLSHHLALLWVGLEATTLSVAPLILDRRDRRSLEAAWKYLVLSSVGIALALLGVFLLATAQPVGAAGGRPLIVEDMLSHARALDASWLRAAFVFIAIGFGTKMGLAPMHAWKPDTYGEAPPLVGGLLAGVLTSCAFLGLARVTAICYAAGLDPFARPILLAFGLASLVIAAAFIVGQGDVRRLLAYSSVEHMGLVALALGLGGVGTYGAVLHVLNNGLVKGLLFLTVGNVMLATGTSTASRIRGLARSLPGSGALLLLGLFAVTGSPPFGPFLSEFTILSAAFSSPHRWVAGAMVLLLAVIFVGMASMILELAYGTPAVPAGEALRRAKAPRERRWLLVAPATLAALVLLMGVYIPPPLARALAGAAAALGGRVP